MEHDRFWPFCAFTAFLGFNAGNSRSNMLRHQIMVANGVEVPICDISSMTRALCIQTGGGGGTLEANARPQEKIAPRGCNKNLRVFRRKLHGGCVETGPSPRKF